MSYDIYLNDSKDNLFKLDEKIEEGGTYVLGGSTDTHLNVTYNYSHFYRKNLDRKLGIRVLYGKKAKDCIKLLEKAIKPYKNHKPNEDDYWDGKNIGNCVKPLKILLSWCKKFPEGTFSGD